MLSAAVPSPCACCNAFECDYLNKAAGRSEKAVWEYTFPAPPRCGRCGDGVSSYVERHEERSSVLIGAFGAVLSLVFRRTWRRYSGVAVMVCAIIKYLRIKRYPEIMRIALPESAVALIERSIEAASVAEKGSKYRAHGTFIHYLAGIEEEDTMKMSLLSWMPYIMDGWMKAKSGFARKLLPKGHSLVTSDPTPVDTHLGNPDVQDGRMPGTMLKGDEYGEETRVKADVLMIPQPRFLATQIGPDIQPTEVMESSVGNLQAGAAKRVQPLPFMADREMRTKIARTVDAVLRTIFTRKRILQWRQDNPDFSEMASKKWSQDRYHHAWDEALAEVGAEVEHEFQIKLNEALPAKNKAPRPIIQSGDKGQIMMMMPVKCFEDLLFEYFEQASIKHVSKHDAMGRVSKHLSFEDAKLIEGDGSAWDSCCTPEIRDLTENKVIQHIINVLANDAQIPQEWMDAMLKDMKKAKIRGKAKMVDFMTGKAKVAIEAIRQSGHRGTSAFNYFINLICWLCVICDDPWNMIPKDNGKLREWYISAADKQWYQMRYAFEGDDSAISTTEKLNSIDVEGLWTSLGFRMKLVFVSNKLTFTGFDFQVGKNGPTGKFVPEIPRNVSSSSWSCSALLKQDPTKAHEIGMAVMLARAENFKDYGPLSAYFAALGLAHARLCGDRAIGEKEALDLGIYACNSVVMKLNDLIGNAHYPDEDMRLLVENSVQGLVKHEEMTRALTSHFDNPCDTQEALIQLPKAMWGVSGLEKPRR